MTEPLPALESLLNGYRAASLKTIRAFNNLPEQPRTKDEVVAQLADHFQKEAHIRAAVAALDGNARQLLEWIQHSGGRIEWNALLAIAQQAQIVTAPATRTRYSQPEIIEGEPGSSSLAYQHVLARLEARGLILGTAPLDGSKSVIDIGLGRMYAIPEEVSPHLPPPPPLAKSRPIRPAQILTGQAERFSRELYALWSYIWKAEPILLSTSSTLSKKDLKALATQHPHAFDPGKIKREDDLVWLYFQRRLLQHLGLVQQQGNQLRGDQEAALRHWSLPMAERAAEWLRLWREGSWWVELNYLPDAIWRPSYATEREHTPPRLFAARERLIRWLGVQMKGEEWFRLSDLRSRLMLTARDLLLDYQPYGHYYHSYHIAPNRYQPTQNLQGWSFEKVMDESSGWMRVEGGLVQHTAELLYWMGLMELGQDDQGKLLALRLTPLGRHLLAGEEAPPAEERTGGRIVLQPNFHLVAFGPVAEHLLLEVERFADRLASDQAIQFELTRASLYRAQQAGLDAATVVQMLETLTGATVPQNVERTLRDWQTAHERIIIHSSATLLQVAEPEMLDRLAGDAKGALRVLAPTFALVTKKAAVARALREAELEAVAKHDRQGADGLTLSDDGTVCFRHKVPDLYLLGRLQQLAEPVEGGWRLTAGSVRRAAKQAGLDATAQVAAWREIVFGELPGWVEPRIKSWSQYYGEALLHQTPLLEVRDAEVLKVLQSDPRIGARLKSFKPRGPLISFSPEDEAALRELLAEYGIELKE